MIQDSINGIVSSVAQGVGVTTGLNKLKESNEYAKSNAQIAKAQNEVQRIDLSNQLDKFEGDLANEVRHDSKNIASIKPNKVISEEDLMKYSQNKISSEEKNYNEAYSKYTATNNYENLLKAKDLGRTQGQIQSSLMNNGKIRKKAMSDMDAANLATKT